MKDTLFSSDCPPRSTTTLSAEPLASSRPAAHRAALQQVLSRQDVVREDEPGLDDHADDVRSVVVAARVVPEDVRSARQLRHLRFIDEEQHARRLHARADVYQDVAHAVDGIAIFDPAYVDRRRKPRRMPVSSLVAGLAITRLNPDGDGGLG